MKLILWTDENKTEIDWKLFALSFRECLVSTQGLSTQNSNSTHTDRYEKNILRGGNCFMFGLKFLSDFDLFSTGNKF